MTLVRRLARPCSPRCSSSAASTRCATPASKVPAAEPDRTARSPRSCPTCPTTPSCWCGSTAPSRSRAGLLLATGRLPRLSSAVLAGSLVPTTAGRPPVLGGAGRRRERAQQRIHFFKNLGMLGGLLLAAVDTEGKPGLAWRAQHAAQHAADGTRPRRADGPARGQARGPRAPGRTLPG